jgi:hypothetical protein
MSAIPQQDVIQQILKDNASIRHNSEILNASKKYQIIDTVDVLNRLINENFEPIKWTKTNKKFNSHQIVLKHKSLKKVNNNDELNPTVYLTNSNNKVKSFSLNLGFYRLACSNGLTVFDSLSHLNRKHIGENTLQIVDDFLNNFNTSIDEKIEIIRKFDSIQMSEDDMISFAMEALFYKFGKNNKKVIQDANSIVKQILVRNRTLDRENTLWRVYNTVQENLFNGNFNVNGRKNRGISSSWTQEYVNKKLWLLADDYSEKLLA